MRVDLRMPSLKFLPVMVVEFCVVKYEGRESAIHETKCVVRYLALAMSYSLLAKVHWPGVGSSASQFRLFPALSGGLCEGPAALSLNE